MKKTFTIRRDQKQEIIISEPGEYLVKLIGPGAEVAVKGAFQAKSADKKEVTIIIHHQAPHTLAKTILKGVANDRAHIKFVGRIIIDPECGGSNSFLTERILLLSDTATAIAIPELEILTDDVKCSHAASVTKIPDEQLFYMQSRGISKLQAENLIIEGFLQL